MELYKRVNGVRAKCSPEEVEERQREWAAFDRTADARKKLENRRNAYPPIAEQLDMIYWDGERGTTEWKDMISSIKNNFPID